MRGIAVIDSVPPASADQLISEFRRGRKVLLVLDQSDGEQTGVVAMAAEYCEPYNFESQLQHSYLDHSKTF